MTKIGILLFDTVEELDFVGPYEVFTMAREVALREGQGRAPIETQLIAQEPHEITCAKGMRVVPHKSFAEIDALDVVVVPGGMGTRREVENPTMLNFIEKVSRGANWITSVCTGSLLLTAAGPARGKRVTTHWAFCQTLRERREASEVLENVRYVRDGNVVTAAGVSAGIDMALWLVGQLEGPAFARAVQRAMEYDPAPPYSADV